MALRCGSAWLLICIGNNYSVQEFFYGNLPDLEVHWILWHGEFYVLMFIFFSRSLFIVIIRWTQKYFSTVPFSFSSFCERKTIKWRIYTCIITVPWRWCAGWCANLPMLRGCPCKNRPLDFRPKTELLQIFRVRQLVHVINKKVIIWLLILFSIFLATISEDGTKPLKIVLFRVKFRRCAEGAEKLFFPSNTIKTNRSFYFMFCLLIKGIIFEIGQKKSSLWFFENARKEHSETLSGHAAGWRSVSQKYNVIRSPDQYPCLVLELVYLEQEKKVWALAFLNYRSSINIANI